MLKAFYRFLITHRTLFFAQKNSLKHRKTRYFAKLNAQFCHFLRAVTLKKMDIILYIGKINIVLGLKGGLVNEKK